MSSDIEMMLMNSMYVFASVSNKKLAKFHKGVCADVVLTPAPSAYWLCLWPPRGDDDILSLSSPLAG